LPENSETKGNDEGTGRLHLLLRCLVRSLGQTRRRLPSTARGKTRASLAGRGHQEEAVKGEPGHDWRKLRRTPVAVLGHSSDDAFVILPHNLPEPEAGDARFPSSRLRNAADGALGESQDSRSAPPTAWTNMRRVTTNGTDSDAHGLQLEVTAAATVSCFCPTAFPIQRRLTRSSWIVNCATAPITRSGANQNSHGAPPTT
jgi:hypothetical protein